MREFYMDLNTTTTGSINAYFGIDLIILIGTITIDSPIGRILFYVMEVETLFLLCLQDMNKLRIFFNNILDTIVMKNKFIISVVRIYEHLFLVWGPISMNFLNDTELR